MFIKQSMQWILVLGSVVCSLYGVYHYVVVPLTLERAAERYLTQSTTQLLLVQQQMHSLEAKMNAIYQSMHDATNNQAVIDRRYVELEKELDAATKKISWLLDDHQHVLAQFTGEKRA